MLFAVDLLELSGKDMRHAPPEARKRKLAKLLGRGSWALHFNSSITRAPCRKVMGVPGQRSHAAW